MSQRTATQIRRKARQYDLRNLRSHIDELLTMPFRSRIKIAFLIAKGSRKTDRSK